MDILGILSIVVAIIIAVVPYIWRRYFSRPELTIEVIKGNGVSMNIGVSAKNDISKGYIEGNSAILIFRLTWEFKIIIRNNSETVAYYPKLRLDSSAPKFTKMEKLNELVPISSKEPVELKVEYFKFEECQGKDRTDVGIFPMELANMLILLEYKNSFKVKSYTLYNQSGDPKNNFSFRRPKTFQ